MKKISQFSTKTGTSTFKVFSTKSHIDDLYKTVKWLNHRKKFLAANPNCYCCRAPATISDHLVAHKGDIELFFQSDNIIPLCKRCHDRITALFDRHAKQKYQDKLRFIARSRAQNEVSTRVFVVPF